MTFTIVEGLLFRINYFRQFILDLTLLRFTFYIFPVDSRDQLHNSLASPFSLLGIQLSFIEGNHAVIKKPLAWVAVWWAWLLWTQPHQHLTYPDNRKNSLDKDYHKCTAQVFFRINLIFIIQTVVTLHAALSSVVLYWICEGQAGKPWKNDQIKINFIWSLDFQHSS